MTETRINARLDKQSTEDLEFLRHELGDVSTTNVLKYSLRRLAQEFRDRGRAKVQKDIWRDSGFIASFDGVEDLSANYKEYLVNELDKKYPPRK